MRVTFDFHIHSCLSPCAAPEMTPRNIAAMAGLCGLTAFAVSDHNTCRQCPAVLAAAAELGLLAIPAMELNTAEEAHVLCLLPDMDAAAEFSGYVYRRLPDVENRPDIWGPQTVMDKDDNVVDEEPRPLWSAAAISVNQTAALLARFGGVAIPAHIDRPSWSVISNLGLWDPAWGFAAYEVRETGVIPGLEERFPALKALRGITNSDAHDLARMGAFEPHTLACAAPSARAVIDALKQQQ